MRIDQDYYTLNEVAKLLGKSKLTIQRWVAKGTFPPPTPAGFWTAKAIRNFLDGKWA